MRRFADTMAWAEDRGGFAIHAAVDERLGFIRRTYAHLLGMLLGVAAVTVLVLQTGLAERFTIPVALIGLLAILFLVPRLLTSGASAGKQYLAAGICTLFFGFLMAPLAIVAAHVTGSYAVLGKAFVITACIFTGLTAYVFMTKKDFSFMRGMLVTGLWVAIGFSVIGLFFGGFGSGMQLLVSFGVVVLFCGFILYDTSNVLHHYPVNAHVAAAVALLMDFVILFQRIVIILIALTGRE